MKPNSIGRYLASHLLLIVMAMSFLSPALGTQALADHDQLHAQARMAAPPLEHHSHGDPDVHGEQGMQDSHASHDGHGDHDDSHALIGHLFLHMPMCIAIGFHVPVLQLETGGEIAVPQFSPSPGVPELPFKPPRSVLFV